MSKLLLLLLPAALTLSAAPILYTVGGNPNTGAPDQLVQINGATISTLATLGSGSTGYAGGIASSASNFLLLESDPFANTSLVSSTNAGILSTLLATGQAAWGGLAFAGSDLYAIRNDSFGASSLVRLDVPNAAVVDLGFNLGFGFTGGLTYNNNDGNLYAISNDGPSTLLRLNLGTLTTNAMTVDLSGAFFNGGLAYDSASSRFYAIGNNNLGEGALYSFTGTTLDATSLAIGQGYYYASLSTGSAVNPPPGSEVPEPSSIVLAFAGMAILAKLRANLA
jgi:hypothetical protein